MKSYIEQLFASLGLPETPYSGLGNVSPESIASGLASSYGIDPSLLPSSLFTGITPGLLKGTYGKTYSPLIQARTSPLLQGLTSSIEGHKGKRAFGNFAASRQGTEYEESAKDVYGKGVTDILTDVSSSMADSEQNIIDLINSWKDTGLGIRYGQGMV